MLIIHDVLILHHKPPKLVGVFMKNEHWNCKSHMEHIANSPWIQAREANKKRSSYCVPPPTVLNKIRFESSSNPQSLGCQKLIVHSALHALAVRCGMFIFMACTVCHLAKKRRIWLGQNTRNGWHPQSVFSHGANSWVSMGETRFSGFLKVVFQIFWFIGFMVFSDLPGLVVFQLRWFLH